MSGTEDHARDQDDRRERGPAGTGAHTGRDARGPAVPGGRSWKAVLRRALRRFAADELTDRAAALTYYGVLALFPALLVVVAVVGVLEDGAVEALLKNVQHLAPGSVRDILTRTVRQLRDSAGTGSVLAAVGLLGALWSASGYVGAFIRTANAVHGVPEDRPGWKVARVRLGLTVLLLVLLAADALIVVFTGSLARTAGDMLGLGDTALTAWSVAKWPVLLVLVAFMIALLYRGAPNVRGRGLRWVTPGSVLALAVWLVASAAFGVYVAGFHSYNETYGALAGAVVFLVWLWLTNLALLLGLELDVELARQRAPVDGRPRREAPYTGPRDTRNGSDSPGDGHGEAEGGPGRAA